MTISSEGVEDLDLLGLGSAVLDREGNVAQLRDNGWHYADDSPTVWSTSQLIDLAPFSVLHHVQRPPRVAKPLALSFHRVESGHYQALDPRMYRPERYIVRKHENDMLWSLEVIGVGGTVLFERHRLTSKARALDVANRWAVVGRYEERA